ncbi:hypothetical protein ES703_89345 [subsurface metagenome]
MTLYDFLILTATTSFPGNQIGKVESLAKILVKKWTQTYVMLITTSQHYCRDSRGPCAVCLLWEDLDKPEANKPVLLAVSFSYRMKTWDRFDPDGSSHRLPLCPTRFFT